MFQLVWSDSQFKRGLYSFLSLADICLLCTGVCDSLGLSDTDLLCGLLETMVVLWEGARDRLNKPSNKVIRNKLSSKVADNLPLFFNTFKVCSNNSLISNFTLFLFLRMGHLGLHFTFWHPTYQRNQLPTSAKAHSRLLLHSHIQPSLKIILVYL